MDTANVTLKRPIERKGEDPIKVLTLREPTGRDLKILDKTPGAMAGTMALACAVCEEGVTPAEIDELPASDVLAIADALGKWLGPAGQ